METKQKPFFAKFLEAQAKQYSNPVNHTAPTEEQLLEASVTKPWLDLEQTQKYPSDGDEI